MQAKAPAVSGLGYRYDGRQVLVSFSLERTFDREDLKEAILSTRSITFTYKVQLVRHRAAWKDAVVARTKLERTVVYDNLTRQFTVESSVDGREAEKRTVETWEEMAALLSSVRDLPLASVADLTPQDRYSVRAKVHLLSDSFLWIIPWDLETDWESLRLKTP